MVTEIMEMVTEAVDIITETMDTKVEVEADMETLYIVMVQATARILDMAREALVLEVDMVMEILEVVTISSGPR
jgi:hypothetical protein